MTEVEHLPGYDPGLERGGVECLVLDVRQREPHDEVTPFIERIRVEDELVRVHEAGDQDAVADQDAASLAPHLSYIGDEERGDRIHDQVEARVAER